MAVWFNGGFDTFLRQLEAEKFAEVDKVFNNVQGTLRGMMRYSCGSS